MRSIKPDEGILYPLIFDQHSVTQVRLEGKDVLYPLKNGAVHYVGDTIAVYDVLEIKGDVNFNTGNIDFDGYVNIKGTVEDNFIVKATKDVEISGVYGIGGVNLIESTEGSIYIRGGVAGKNKAKIKCKGNLYAKFIADAEVICEGSVYVGFYIRNSRIRATQVIVESGRGQIVGGLIDADVRVESADIGNRMENRTIINIRGFNRELMKFEMDGLLSVIQAKKKQLSEMKEMLKSFNKDAQKSKSKAKNSTGNISFAGRNKTAGITMLKHFKLPENPGEGAVIVKITSTQW